MERGPMSDPVITIGGSTRTSNVRKDSLVIVDELNEAPNTCSFSCDGFTPTINSEIIITLSGTREFGGHITKLVQGYDSDNPASVVYHCEATDYTRLLDRRKVLKRYTATSASTIVTSILSSFTTGFTTAGVVGSLPTIDAIDFTYEDVSRALTRVAKLVGAHWYVDYSKDVHFFLTETTTPPDDITTATPHGARALTKTSDSTQQRTRTLVEGAGSFAAVAVAAGATILPVDDEANFSTTGGTVRSGPQAITYTGASKGTLGYSGTWTANPAPTADGWDRIAWAAGRKLFVSVSQTGSGGANSAMSSPDGARWTGSALPSVAWDAIGWSPALGLFVALGASAIYTSPDAVTWTSRTVPSGAGGRTWSGNIAWSPALGIFAAAAGGGGSGAIITSTDGVTWTSRTEAATCTGGAGGIVWSPELAKFVVVKLGTDTSTVETSTDGTTWTAQSETHTFRDLCWSARLGLFVAVGSSIAYTSPTGATWTSRTVPAVFWRRVVWADGFGLFFAVGDAGALMTSPDGITWTSVTGAISGDFRGIAYASEIGTVVATATNGTTRTMVTTARIVGQLTGVPASGAGAVVYDIAAGDEVNVLVTRNDTSAQSTLAGQEGGDGIHEHYIQDRRLASATCTDLGDADLGLYSAAAITVEFESRDTKLRSGKSILLNLSSPTSISGTFTIQRVVTSQFGMPTVNPLRQVIASTFRFTLDDVFRRLEADA
jgi:hypothetical protein